MRFLFFIQLSLVWTFFCVSNSGYSQVTIGSSLTPNQGSLLDLKEYEPKENNENAYRGLLLPRVALTNLKNLEDIKDVNPESGDIHVGLLVYNTLENKECGIPVGLYTWNGKEWQYMQNKSTNEAISGSYSEDVAILKKIMDDNPENALDWKIDDSDRDNMKFISGSGVTFKEICGDQRLVKLIAKSKNLTSLNLKGASTLEYLDCENNQITTLNLEGLSNIKNLYCEKNKLSSLDVSNFTKLVEIYCFSNKLSTLDVSGLESLKELRCYTNQLTSLDLSDSKELIRLSCSENKISSLNLSGLSKLKSLICNQNELTSLNVSDAVELSGFVCNNNLLTSLNVSENKSLTYLDCSKNKISSLDLLGLNKITTLNCLDNDFLPESVSICESLYNSIPSRQIIPSKTSNIYKVAKCKQ